MVVRCLNESENVSLGSTKRRNDFDFEDKEPKGRKSDKSGVVRLKIRMMR